MSVPTSLSNHHDVVQYLQQQIQENKESIAFYNSQIKDAEKTSKGNSWKLFSN